MSSPGKAAGRLVDLATRRTKAFSSDSFCFFFSSEIRRLFADSEVLERKLEVRG